MSRFLVALLLLCSTLAPPPAAAQGRLPKRPRLPGAADTNDARAYYDRGLALLENDPALAADAFYWATRLEPGWAEALYARRIAGFMAHESMLVRYLDGVRGVVSGKDAQALDSLEFRAQKLNPFFRRDLDRTFVYAYLMGAINSDIRRRGGSPLNPSQKVELDYYINGYLASGASLWLRGAVAASERRFPQALDLYRRALLEEKTNRVGILIDRARAFYDTDQPDSALAQLQGAIAELEKREADRLVRVYESKELFEHSIGMIHEQTDNLAAAREAYGRALQENLSYYPAHTRLGLVALVAGDTATALSELDLSVQLAPQEITARVTYGTLLARVGRTEEAMTHLQQAADVEPYYAMPHYLLGRVAEARQDTQKAIASYRAFLARASQRDQRRAEVVQRVADLGP